MVQIRHRNGITTQPRTCHLGPELPFPSSSSGVEITDSVRLARPLHASSATMTPSIQKHSCASCARRKVKCDKATPCCSKCSKSRSECVYQALPPSQRHRKRPPDEDLLSRIAEYEHLLRKNNIQFQPLDNSWISSPLEQKLVSRSRNATAAFPCAQPQVLTEVERPSEAPDSEARWQADVPGAKAEAARLWSELPKEVCDPSPGPNPAPQTLLRDV
jgi:hypothetical protein